MALAGEAVIDEGGFGEADGEEYAAGSEPAAIAVFRCWIDGDEIGRERFLLSTEVAGCDGKAEGAERLDTGRSFGSEFDKALLVVAEDARAIIVRFFSIDTLSIMRTGEPDELSFTVTGDAGGR